MDARRYDVDWARVLATMTIFLYHNTRLFDTFPWHVKNGDTSVGATILVGVLDAWTMPLFFLLSGVAAWFVLGRKGWRGYLKSRILRLLVPFYLAGCLLVLPVSYALNRLGSGQEFSGLRDVYLAFFQTFHTDALVPFFIPFPGHLWFLLFLFSISLVTLPLCLLLLTDRGARIREGLVRMCRGVAGPFVLSLPLFLVLVAVRGVFPGQFTPADFVYYACWFLIGFVFISEAEGMDILGRWMWAGLAAGLAGFCLEGFLVLEKGYPVLDQSFEPLGQYVAFQAVMSVQTLGWILFILGCCRRWLNRPGRMLARANTAVLPFYILHETVILCVGWFVVQLSWSIPAKLALNGLASLALILAIYLLLIRPFNPVRFAFGMGLRRRKPQG